MPEYPVNNDNEVSLLKKIVENTADIAAGGGGGGAVASVNGQTGVVVLDASDVGAATQAEVNLKAPIDSPTFTGAVAFETDGSGVAFSDNGNQVANLDEVAFQLKRPIVENVREIGNADSPNIEVTDLIIFYTRNDQEPIVVPSVGDSSLGQHLTISNGSSDIIDIEAPDPNSFLDGSNGIVSSLSMAVGETIMLISIGNVWRVVSRYV